MYSFHLETQIDDLYGNFSFQDGQVAVVKGPIYQAVEYGKILIADKFNLSEEPFLKVCQLCWSLQTKEPGF